MSNVQEIVEGIDKLSVVELQELNTILKEKLDVTIFGVQIFGNILENVQQTKEAEQTEFSVRLEKAGERKIEVIKRVREFLALDLKSSKDLVDAAPKVIKEGLSKDDAEKLKSLLIGAGAEVSVI